MVEVELIVEAATLAIVLVVVGLVGVAYLRTRIRRLLVLLLLATLLGVNMTVAIAEDILEGTVPYIELLTSLLSLGIAVLLFVTVVWRFGWEPE